MIRDMAMEQDIGVMVLCMWVNGRMERNMDRANTPTQRNLVTFANTFTKENGKMMKVTAMGKHNGVMAMFMWVNGRMERNMDRANTPSQRNLVIFANTFTKENGKMMRVTAMEKHSGVMAMFM